MEDLHKKEKYDLKILESFILNEIEETIHIDFKSSGALSKEDAKKREISKDVASFANSDGGIIIYGISEKNHKASHFSYIDGNIFTKEWLEQVISSTINRNIPGLKIYPVRKGGNIEQSLYIVQIPASLEAPHMSKDKRFYKRFNFESVMMEEYEVRSLYGRRAKSKLSFDGHNIGVEKSLVDGNVVIRFSTYVYNEGDRVEENYKVNIYLNGEINKINLSWDQFAPTSIKDYSYFDDRIKVTCYSKQPIYPGESVTGIRFKFTIAQEHAFEVLQTLKIKSLLFYMDGEDSMEIALSDLCDQNTIENLLE